MQTILRVALLFAVVSALPYGRAEAVELKYYFQVTQESKSKVEQFHKSAKEVEDMRNYGIPNDPVYVKNTDKSPLLPIYDLFACIKLTNPTSDMQIDSGGGFDISIDNVKFANGTWPVDLRILSIEQIHFLEKTPVFLIESMRIGTLKMGGADEKIDALKIMVAGCLAP